MKSFARCQSIVVLALVALLSACGGAGESDGKSAPNTTSPSTGNPGSPSNPSHPGNPSDPSSPADAGKLVFPMELLSDGSPQRPLVAEVNLSIDASSVASATQLYFVCHRCGFYAAPEYEAVGTAPAKVKASLRLLGAQDTSQDSKVAWTDVTDSTVQLADDERLHGGLSGGFYTTRITVNLDSTTRARLAGSPKFNRLQFRFNGTDGESNGFRVLSVELRDGSGKNLLTNQVVQADPQAEKVPTASQADVDAGKTLWHGRGINSKSILVSRKIEAACSSCHSFGGEDLQYFNYSNNSIVQRSKFHGLSETQGKQIVAYLRKSLAGAAYVDKARPWNPPFQPGPGLDCTGVGCEKNWSAGAGLDAVLSSTSDVVKAMFGKDPASLSQADVDKVMDANATMNVRETKIAMQFPDWNAWLPSIHPLDVWPAGSTGGFEGGAVFNGSGAGRLDPNAAYANLEAWFKANKNSNGVYGDWSHLNADQRTTIMALMTQAGWTAYTFLGGGRGDHIADNGQIFGAQVGAANLQKFASSGTTASNPAAFTTNAFIERAVASMLHWNALKQWELARRYGLEGNQKWFIGEKDKTTGVWVGRGDAHGWPFNTVSAFYLAPHMVYQTDTDGTGKVTREWYTAWEANNIVGSYYRSNQWYQLQMTINPGGQSGWVNYPMDWPYLTAFDDYLGQKVGTATPAAKNARNTHYARLLQARIMSAQYVNNDLVLYDPAQPNLFANEGRYGRGQTVKHLTPASFMDQATNNGKGQSVYKFLDDLAPGLYLKVVNGSVKQFNQLYAQTDAAAWRRCDPSNTSLGEPEHIAGFRYCLDAQRKPLGKAADGTYFMNQESYRSPTEQSEQYGVWKGGQIGVEAQRLKTYSDWVNRMWP